ncbi:hypothetical protein K503DRAFT_116192 [Rhizopogon vinicolor AM-OR11-026]|uniref:Uncharacterized protein n=1 Tax=Rhizopogon vinicolor AM-OR11-026 TaxID=1314800 RepID=A0A1B7N2D9_9AGAM|nr:hypothetical protein K503DRAFT_116192 [Rhizopogon vinicolor AM-OR11-026]
MLDTFGVPFEGHTKDIYGLALSFDGALLASTSGDNTIKLWAVESHLASFYSLHPYRIIFSPISCQLAYTTVSPQGYKIYICNIPPNILASIVPAVEGHKVGAHPRLRGFHVIICSRRPVQLLGTYSSLTQHIFLLACAAPE